MKRANGAFRALVEAGASYTGGECLNAGRSRRPTCKLNGVDMITFADDGRITHFKVMVRPLKAINLLHRLMGEQLAN